MCSLKTWKLGRCETLKRMGVVDEDFPKAKNSKFEEGAEKLSEVEEEDEEDEYSFFK